MFIKSNKYKIEHIPTIRLGCKTLDFVHSYKYLGCIINESLSDNNDIKRTLRGIYARANMLIRKFYFCSDTVKRTLFRTYCTNFYCTQLWWTYTKEVLRKVQIAFNNSFRMLMGYNRRCSASGMFVGADIDNCNTLRRKYVYSFTSRLQSSNNNIIYQLYNYRNIFALPSVKEFYQVLHSSQAIRFLE